MKGIVETMKKHVKMIVILSFIAACCVMTLYFHAIIKYSMVFSHLFYIPIILASLWWQKRGLVVPIFLAFILLVSHIIFRSQVMIFDDVFRALIFITIGFVFAVMSEQITEKNEALAVILEGSPIPAFIIDPTHRITHWNRALEEMSGMNASKMLGTQEHWKAFYKQKRPCMADLLIDQQSEDICIWYDGAHTCSPSEYVERAYEATDFFPALGNEGRWIRFTAALLRDSKGYLRGAIETLEDISERKFAEEALKESEQKLKTILEGSSIPTFVIDKNHTVLHWNKALEEMSEIRADEVIGTQQHWRAFYDDERPCMADLIADDRLDEIPIWYAGSYHESELINEAYEAIDFFPDLGVGGKWLRFSAAALRDSKGTLVGVIETLEDITDRRLAEEALKESERHLKVVLEGSPIPTFVIDSDHQVLYWNKALEEMSAIHADKVIGTSQHWKAFYDQERPCMADLLIDGLIDEVPHWYSGRYHKLELIEDAYDAIDFFPALGAGGKWLRFTAATLRDSKGILFGAIETLEDITDRKLAEEALKESELRYMELSITDALTKLFNSRHFYAQLKSEAERASRYKHPLSILILDIDDFKDYNDSYGHLEGDQVLSRLGKVIRRCLRTTDSGYRYGGEEFTLLLPETKGEAAIALAERIRREFESESFSPIPDAIIHKTVSVGVTEYIEGEDITILLKRADEGMYTAKRQGKNRVFFSKT